MTGELYFEVAKVFIKHRRTPFIVSTNKQKVEVLGTHFNINAYSSQQFEKTTLAEGSVRVKPVTNFATQVLKPGELALLRAREQMRAFGYSQTNFLCLPIPSE